MNGDKKEDDCGVYEEADNGFGFQENCEYIHETVIVVKAVTYPNTLNSSWQKLQENSELIVFLSKAYYPMSRHCTNSLS